MSNPQPIEHLTYAIVLPSGIRLRDLLPAHATAAQLLASCIQVCGVPDPSKPHVYAIPAAGQACPRRLYRHERVQPYASTGLQIANEPAGAG